MKRTGVCVAIVGVVAAVASRATALAADSPSAVAAAPSAESLVEEAIAAGLAGEAARRAELLAAAVEADPNYEAARWLSGQLRFEGKWRTVDEVSARVADDPRWAEYAARRRSLAGTPADHAELARWCMREGLENEERLHWMQVLRADPQYELARTRLELQEYRGGLYTAEQIAEHEQRLVEAEQNLAKFTPVFAELCRRAGAGADADREAALVELRGVDDPAVIEALELAVAEAAGKAGPELALELRRTVIVVLSNIRAAAATQKLLGYSVFAADPEIRRLAAEALGPRRVTDYVPQLMAALSMPIEAEFFSFTAPDGSARCSSYMYQAGPLANYTTSRQVSVNVRQIGGSRGPDGGPGPNTRARQRQLRHDARAMEVIGKQRVAAANLELGVRNQRIREALYNALEIDFGPDPRTYWQEWTSYNELYVSERPTISLGDTCEYYYIPTISCFALGTPVWTQGGPKAIERVAVGDLVLSQHPATGELAYRPVIETTVRPPTKMVRVTAGGAAVEATLGHRFWINGEGWAMAKFLAPEKSLHALQGPAALSAFEPLAVEEVTEAYNLVVDDFHTYFVGASRLLVHDNTCPQPTVGVAPGRSGSRHAADARDAAATQGADQPG